MYSMNKKVRLLVDSNSTNKLTGELGTFTIYYSTRVDDAVITSCEVRDESYPPQFSTKLVEELLL